MARGRWLGVSLLTGVGGLGSESVHLKLVDQTVGSGPVTAPVVAATFIAGLGLGALASHRVRRPLFVEATLAIYYLLLGTWFEDLAAANAQLLLPLARITGPTAGAALLGSTYVLVPAVLLGITFPWVAEQAGNPARAYAAQGVGAFGGLVAIDALVYPSWGTTASIFALAAVHAVIAALVAAPASKRPAGVGGPLSVRLLLLGVSTGALQGVWLVLTRRLFQPFYFVAPTVLATFLGGLAIGAFVWLRLRWSLGRTVEAIVLGAAVAALAAAGLARLSQPASLMSQTLQVALVTLPLAIPIGALFPAFIGTDATDRRTVGRPLLVLSAGNSIGLVAAAFGLLSFVSELAAHAAVTVALAAGAIRLSARPTRLVTAAGIAIASVAATPETTMLQRANRGVPIESVEVSFRRFGETSGVLRYVAPRRQVDPGPPHLARRLHQNGYSPLVLDHNMEGVIAAVGAAYAPKHDRLLVVGAGSGRTAGVGANLFETIDVVDLAATTRPLLEHLRADNFGIANRPKVRLHQHDAILTPHLLPGPYDLIVLSVDPVFLSTSAKLYTLEQLEAFGRTLAPGGVLVFWADGYLDLEASQVLVNTAGQAFDHRRLFSVVDPKVSVSPWDYFLIVGSDAPLSYRTARPTFRAPPPDRFIEAAFSRGEARSVVGGRMHPTQQVHRLGRPAWPLLVAGHRYALGGD